MNNEIVVHNASKIFQLRNEKKIFALNNVSITIKQGVFYAIMGHSGAGKSTLIQILGLLDNLSDGEIYIDGINVHNLSEKEKSYIRMNNIGFIFQSFYLNSKLKAIENVMLPMYINTNINKKDRKIYDILIIDECSTVSDKEMKKILNKQKYKLIILSGDIYQIESIKYGNWSSYS